VTLGNNTLCTVKVREDEEINNEKGPKIIDLPKIEVTIFARKYIALLDTGATTSVCSEALYNRIKQLGENLIAIPTCGLYCSTAIERKRQRFRLKI
jgi:Retroviral aspartyl protease.